MTSSKNDVTNKRPADFIILPPNAQLLIVKINNDHIIGFMLKVIMDPYRNFNLWIKRKLKEEVWRTKEILFHKEAMKISKGVFKIS